MTHDDLGTAPAPDARLTTYVGAAAPDRPTADAAAARNVEAVRRLFEAVERRDADGFQRAYDDAVVVRESPSLPYGGEYRGAEGLARHAAGYMGAWDALQGDEERRLTPEFIAGGDRVAVLWHQRARNPGSGETLDMPTVSVYRLRDDRVVESQMFHFDSTAVRAFLDRAHGGAGPTDVEAGERALNAMIEAGEYAAALERFYADDVVMQEDDRPATVGKAANQAREDGFFRVIARLEAQRLGGAVAGAASYSEWAYRLELRSGRTFDFRQVAAREWRGGRVARETFYRGSLPEWVIEEIGAAMADAASTTGSAA